MDFLHGLDRQEIWKQLALDLTGKADPDLCPIYPQFRACMRAIYLNPDKLTAQDQEAIWTALDAWLSRLRIVEKSAQSWLCNSEDVIAYYIAATDCDRKWLLEQAGIRPFEYERERKALLYKIIHTKVRKLRTTLI